jgi:hypothetical protein
MRLIIYARHMLGFFNGASASTTAEKVSVKAKKHDNGCFLATTSLWICQARNASKNWQGSARHAVDTKRI